MLSNRYDNEALQGTPIAVNQRLARYQNYAKHRELA